MHYLFIANPILRPSMGPVGPYDGPSEIAVKKPFTATLYNYNRRSKARTLTNDASFTPS